MKALVALPLLFQIAASGAATAEDCGPTPYRLRFDIDAPEARVEHGRSSGELSGMLVARAMPGYVTRGVTSLNYKAGYRADLLTRRMPGGGWCARVVSATVEFGFASPPRIHIDRELRTGSCEYRAVLEHEYEHLRIGHESLAEGRSLMDAELRRLLDAGGVAAPTAEDANRILDERVAEALNEVTKLVYARAAVRNSALDTPESYRRLSEACR